MEIHESLQRIMKSESLFGDTFYEIFFDQCPAACKHFERVDMKRQALVLTMALTLIEQYVANGYPAIAQYLRHLGTAHGDKGIPREMYVNWRDAMLTSLEKFHGDEWNDSLSDAWAEAIDATTQVMFEGYDHRVGL